MSEAFGCAVCRALPVSRENLWLVHERSLYEGPHEGYALFACPECRQPFLEQFQEITWLPNGDDHIWLRWMPITEQEREEVERLFPNATESDAHTEVLAKLMHTREWLVRDPDGVFAWNETPRDAGNLYPPG